jgi:hypothetical protein
MTKLNKEKPLANTKMMHETEFTSCWRQLSGRWYGDGGTEGAADETLDADEDALKT